MTPTNYGRVNYDPVKAPRGICGQCEQDFPLKGRSQLGAVNSGRLVFCSTPCRSLHYSGKKYGTQVVRGPCPTCGKMFQTVRKDKKYCSMECYVSHDDTKKRLRGFNEARKKPPRSCPNCGEEFQHKSKKYCSVNCRREYFAMRFDRFVANPEKLALPQCYDEFLMQAELPCLVDGCDWKGIRLAQHVNFAHGINKDKLKEMAGFNATTGLIPPTERATASARMKKLIADGVISGTLLDSAKRVPGNTKGRKARQEAREHAVKSRALIAANSSIVKSSLRCRECDKAVAQPYMGKKLYCSTQCRSHYYRKQNMAELICSWCGKKFMGKQDQIKRVRRGGKVCCSLNCRNNMNMATCLATRAPNTQR